MSIINQIPHTARPLKVSLHAVALFGNPLIAKYSFNTAVNDELIVFTPRAGCVYLIERLAWAASIPGEVWSDSCQAVRPNFSMYSKRGVQKITIDPYPYTLSTPTQGTDFVSWLLQPQVDKPVYASVRGILNQVSATVGRAQVDLSVDLDIYEISTTEYQKAFVDRLSSQTGQQIRGAL
jgi:hypothetical protein